MRLTCEGKASMRSATKIIPLVAVEQADDVTDTIDRLVELKARMDVLKREEKILKDRVKVFYATGEGPAFVGAHGVVTIREAKGRRSLKSALVEQHLSPEIFEACHQVGSPSLSVTVTCNKVKS